MNWSDKEIDKLFKENAGAPVVEYKDVYWKEMEAMLPAKKGGDMLWMLTSLLFVGLFTVTSFVNLSVTTENNQLIANNIDAQLEEKQLNDESFSQKEKNGASDISHDEYSSTKSETIDNQVSAEMLNLVSSFESITTSEEKVNTASTESLTESRRTQGLKVTHQSTLSDDSDLSMLESTSQKEQQSFTNDIVDKEVYNTDIEVIDAGEVLSGEETAVLQSEAISSNKNESADKYLVEMLAVTPLKRIEVDEQKELGNIADDLTMPIRTQLYTQVLGGLSQSLITPSSSLSYSWGVGAGVTFGKGRFVITTGLNGTWSSHNDLILSREAKVYGFGYDIIRYDLQYKDIFSLEADLSVGYRFGNGVLKLGMRPSYVVGTRVSYERIEKGVSVKEDFYGYADGLNRFGLKPTIGYSYDLRSGFSVGLNIATQLMPLVKQDFINGENSKLPFDAQIYFRKTLKFKK